jgi:hypothetical protein
MIGGVSFQPGSFDQEQQRRQQARGSAQGVQEAIKVLSLRLPKVVGAQAVSPQALLSSPGGGGNPRVDSIVEAVLSKMFPTQGGPAPGAPTIPTLSPGESNTMPTDMAPVRFTGSAGPLQGEFGPQFPKVPKQPEINPNPNPPRVPSIRVDEPTPAPGGVFPPPPPPIDLRQYLDWLPTGPETYSI